MSLLPKPNPPGLPWALDKLLKPSKPSTGVDKLLEPPPRA